MDDFIIIRDIVIILASSIPIIYIFKKFNIPTIIGFLIAGIIIGPFGFSLIQKVDEVEIMAEIGVILLLFTIGLEVSFTQLARLKKYLLFAGSIQVTATILLGALIFYLTGIKLQIAIFMGILLSLSSTAIVLKILSDRGELEAPQGKISLGILIFQDLAIVPMFLMLPILDTSESLSFTEVISKLGIAFGSLILILVLAKYLMPKIIYQLAKLRMRDAFTVGTLLILLGTAYLTHSLGLSFALGAFIAGLILADTDYHTQILSDILPLKDAFNSIFFVSVGLLLNIKFVADYPLVIIAVTISIILFKALIIFTIIKFMKYPNRIAVTTALGLAQIGEFAFILAQASLSYNLLNEYLYNVFLGSTIFSMMLTPFLIKISPALFEKQTEKQNNLSAADQKKAKIKDHVIIAGFGVIGRNLAHVLKETGIPYVVIEMNPDTVKLEKQKGENILFGDISKEEVLIYANIKSASVIVFTIPDPRTAKRAVITSKKINPQIFSVIRTRFVDEVEDLVKSGADSIIPEEFETSLEIFKEVLEKYHIPLNIIMKQTAILRQGTYEFMRKENSDNSHLLHLDEILAQGLTELFFIDSENKYLGSEIRKLDLRAKTGATIIAVIRDGKIIANPSGNELIKENDRMLIIGDHKSVDEALQYLGN